MNNDSEEEKMTDVIAPKEAVTVPPWKKYLPTKKWWTALVAGVAGIVTSAIESGEFGDTEESAVKLLALSLVAAYLKSNDATVGGVPGAVGQKQLD